MCEKACIKCGGLKPLSAFFGDSSKKDGASTYCKECQRELSRKSRDKKKNELQALGIEPQVATFSKKARRAAVSSNSRKYKISNDSVARMHEEQQGKCAICGGKDTTSREKLVIDHCHTTNQVRGLLCSHCNCGIGFFRDSVTALNNAIKYLKTRDYKGQQYNLGEFSF